MERDDFLKMMQENGDKGKEYERFALLKGDNLAACIAGLVGIILMIMKMVARKQFDFGICAVVFTVLCVQSINEGIKLKKWWLIIAGIAQGLFTLWMVLAFIGGVFAQ